MTVHTIITKYKKLVYNNKLRSLCDVLNDAYL